MIVLEVEFQEGDVVRCSVAERGRSCWAWEADVVSMSEEGGHIWADGLGGPRPPRPAMQPNIRERRSPFCGAAQPLPRGTCGVSCTYVLSFPIQD